MQLERPSDRETVKKVLKNEDFIYGVGDAGNALVAEEVHPNAMNTVGEIIRNHRWVVTQITDVNESRFLMFVPLNQVFYE